MDLCLSPIEDGGQVLARRSGGGAPALQRRGNHPANPARPEKAASRLAGFGRESRDIIRGSKRGQAPEKKSQ